MEAYNVERVLQNGSTGEVLLVTDLKSSNADRKMVSSHSALPCVSLPEASDLSLLRLQSFGLPLLLSPGK